MPVIGIDLSQQTLDWAMVETSEGDVVTEGAVANTEVGITALVRVVQPSAPSLIVVESTGADHRPVLSALVAAGLPVTLVNPLQIVGVRQVRLGRAKTDRPDARRLARFGATYASELHTYVAPSTRQAQLRDWTRSRETLIQEQTRLAGRREANGWQGDDQVEQWLANHAASRAAHLAEVDAAIRELLAQLPEATVVQAVKGVGPVVTAAVLGALPLVIWGDAKKASAYVGLVPKLAQSGKRSSSRMSKAGPGDVRRVLWLAARSAIDHDPAMRTWYDTLLARGKTKQLAQCAVMNKLLRHLMGRLKAWQTEQIGAAVA